MVKVLKGLAEFNGVTLGQLLEKIVLHSFEPVPGQEGEQSASPHTKKALTVIADLRRIYGFDYDVHPSGVSKLSLNASYTPSFYSVNPALSYNLTTIGATGWRMCDSPSGRLAFGPKTVSIV